MTSHQPLPLIVGVAIRSCNCRYSRQHGCDTRCGRDRWATIIVHHGRSGPMGAIAGGKAGRCDARPLTVQSRSAGPVRGILVIICA